MVAIGAISDTRATVGVCWWSGRVVGCACAAIAMGVGMEFDENRIPSSTLQELRGILMSSLSRENLGQPDTPPEPRRRKVRFEDNGEFGSVQNRTLKKTEEK